VFAAIGPPLARQPARSLAIGDTTPTAFEIELHGWRNGAHPGAGIGSLRRSIAQRIARNNLRGTATSASWKTTRRAWRTIFAPILINFSESLSGPALDLSRQDQLFEGSSQGCRPGRRDAVGPCCRRIRGTTAGCRHKSRPQANEVLLAHHRFERSKTKVAVVRPTTFIRGCSTRAFSWRAALFYAIFRALVKDGKAKQV